MYDDLVPLTGKCSVCDAESTSRCAGCFAVFYCGADCQKRDWRANDHKARCAKPYRVERTPELGREVAHSITLVSVKGLASSHHLEFQDVENMTG